MATTPSCKVQGARTYIINAKAASSQLIKTEDLDQKLGPINTNNTKRVTEEFTCRGDNGVGGPASASVMVTVLGPPEVALTSAPATRAVCSLDIMCQSYKHALYLCIKEKYCAQTNYDPRACTRVHVYTDSATKGLNV